MILRLFLMLVLIVIYRKHRVRIWRRRHLPYPVHDSIYGGE